MSAVVAVVPEAVSAEITLNYRARKERERARRRDLAWERVRTPVDPATVPDPLTTRPASGRLATIALVVASSFAVHVAVVVVAGLLKTAPSRPRVSYERAVEVQITQTPKAADPTPPTVQPVEPPPKTPVIVKPKKVDSILPPPDPIDTQTPPPPEPPKEPPRRVVGIDMESTTVAGGSAFAAGNTRMGKTEEVAEDPTRLERLAPELIPPKKKNVPLPVYPPSLKARKIEGDVQLEVEVDSTGHVSNVTVVVPSEHEEFNRAAVEAERLGTYEPAKLNGVGVARSIPVNVKFRLDE